MTEPGNNPDRQGDLLRPLAREPDPRERATGTLERSDLTATFGATR